jgi:hypothetical protein
MAEATASISITANVTRRNMLYNGRFISISYTHNDTGIQPQANGSIHMADAVNTTSMVFNTHIQQYVIRFISRYSIFIAHSSLFILTSRAYLSRFR